MVEAKRNIPTILVIFGVTGDLVEKKVIPALWSLFSKGELPEMFKVVGFSRRNLSETEFREYVSGVLVKHNIGANQKKFLDFFSYSQGNFDDAQDYKKLNSLLRSIDDAWSVCSNKIFYFPVPPKYYEDIFENISLSGLSEPCGPDGGWTRVLVEKPFGRDLKSAEYLNRLISKSFDESQIYRLDHYLGKKDVQDILAWRIANNLFGENWGKQAIRQIHIKLFESSGVEERGSFYDDVGALRDMGQSHILQLLALLTMNRPTSIDAHEIREKRAEILMKLRPISEEEVVNLTSRAQHKGYKGIEGVRGESETETYFKVQAYLDLPAWENIPIIFESGKRLGKTQKEIEISLAKDNQPLVFKLDSKSEQGNGEYEKLLLDCILGDQTLFISSGEIKAMWRFIDPIIEAWNKNLVPLGSYEADSHPLS